MCKNTKQCTPQRAIAYFIVKTIITMVYKLKAWNPTSDVGFSKSDVRFSTSDVGERRAAR